MAGVALVGLLAAGVAVLVLPVEAPLGVRPTTPTVAAAPAGSPLLPKVLVNQAFQPRLAFEQAGRPRTLELGLVFQASIGGRKGLYGTDARSGALVRLHDLPGTADRSGAGGNWPDNVALSREGRFLSDGTVLVDLRSARVIPISGALPVVGRESGAPAHNVAVLDDGSVAVVSGATSQLWWYPPPEARRPPQRVAAVDDVDAVQAQPQGQLLVRHLARNGRGSRKPLSDLVDLNGQTPTIFGIPSLGREPAAIRSAQLFRLRPDGKLVSGSLATPPAKAELAASRALKLARMDMLPQVANEPLVVQAFGAGTGTPLAVLQVELDLYNGSRAEPATELTRLDLELLNPGGRPGDIEPAVRQIVMAPDVIARAVVVDVPAEPWWAVLTAPWTRLGAGIVLGGVGLLALWSTWRLLRDRRRRVRFGEVQG